MNLQTRYDLEVAEDKIAAQVARDVQPLETVTAREGSRPFLSRFFRRLYFQLSTFNCRPPSAFDLSTFFHRSFESPYSVNSFTPPHLPHSFSDSSRHSNS